MPLKFVTVNDSVSAPTLDPARRLPFPRPPHLCRSKISFKNSLRYTINAVNSYDKIAQKLETGIVLYDASIQPAVRLHPCRPVPPGISDKTHINSHYNQHNIIVVGYITTA